VDRLGGASSAVDLAGSPFRLEPVSATFHGRDLFAPVAAHLALGARLAEAGEEVEVSSLSSLELPTPEVGSDRVKAHAIHVDGYGNVTLDLDAEMLSGGPFAAGDRIDVRAPDGRFEALWARTFSDTDPGDLLLYEDSSGALALAASGGNAAGLLDLRPGVGVELRPQ
jgi:S-adenosylmethionine hydrolase